MNDSPGSATESATDMVDNLRQRGIRLFYEAKKDKTKKTLFLAMSLFQRGSLLCPHKTSATSRAFVCKNFIVASNLLYQWYSEESNFDMKDVDAMFECLKHASYCFDTVASLAPRLPSNVSPAVWFSSLSKTYLELLSNSVLLIASAEITSTASYAETSSARISRLFQVLDADISSFHSIDALVRYKIVDILLKESVVAGERKQTSNSLACILRSESYLASLQHDMEMAKSKNECLPHLMCLDSLKEQVWYQICASKSAKSLEIGLSMLSSAQGEESEKEADSLLLLAIDAFKEAQVLARETSLPQEAHACARLAFIFRSVPFFKNTVKSDLYYEQAFNLLSALGSQDRMCDSWVQDVKFQRERIQRDKSKTADKRKEPVLEQHKTLLADIKSELNLYARESISKALQYLYQAYPPKGGHELPQKKIDDGEIKCALKTAIRHYHPDRNLENKFGFENFVICEEIVKSLNLLFGRLFKGMD